MGAVYDDLPDHEGYAVRDGNAAWVAACSCGWHDDRTHTAEEDGYQAAIDRWDAIHAAPLLERAVPLHVAALVREAQRAVTELAGHRPRSAATVLDGISRWCAALRRTAGIETGARLDAFVDRSRADGRTLGR